MPFKVLQNKYVPLHLRGNKKINAEVYNEKEEFIKYIVGDSGDFKEANMILNNNLDFTEIVFYKEGFNYTTNRNLKEYTIDGEKIIRNGRKFIEEDGVLIPKETVVLNDLARSINNSTKRAKSTFYNYGLNNDFRYFLTLTFSNKHVDRYNDDDVKYLYQKFRQKLQYINKNVKLLGSPERHKPNNDNPLGALHLHILVGNIDLSKYMSQALSPNTLKNVHCKVGLPMFNLTNWEYGYSTIVEFPENYDRLRVMNYMIGYTTKADNIGYNKKRIFRTGNLNGGTKHIANISNEELEKVVEKYNFEVYKDNDKMIVFRHIKKTKEQLSLLKNDNRHKITEIKSLGKEDPFKNKRKNEYEN